MPSSKKTAPDVDQPFTHAGPRGIASRTRFLVRRLVTALAVLLLVLAAPAAVSAHAELVLASPAPGTGLAQAPAAVLMKFSEPLNLGLSRIEILDASGADVGQGPTEPVTGDPAAMRRPLGLLPTGQYTVRWTTVSPIPSRRPTERRSASTTRPRSSSARRSTAGPGRDRGRPRHSRRPGSAGRRASTASSGRARLLCG